MFGEVGYVAKCDLHYLQDLKQWNIFYLSSKTFRSDERGTA